VPDNAWLDDAACRNHPVLGPDAWSGVINGRPQGDGARALMVCQRSCPVKQVCREQYQGIETIAGGGWFNSKGQFQEPVDELLDVSHAAAYLDLDVERVRRMVGRRLPVTDKRGGRAWFKFEDIVRISMIYDPPHGSSQRHKLHELRGERVCSTCRTAMESSLSAYAS